ncbi:serine hydrolase domain-containing protein [Lentilactobacillus buchneri]|uniref:Beta-lactamase-related domain-containing protein n=1 Tax=Lentilactobacillus buchneri DSM 20057 TaxID=1423728 RepID=A0A4V3A4D8_LENBU|nr:serine hydrolase domain-containing protein [Lentilactobacillus buchneri]KRK68318.1 beta-lactamase [Lentilactobacillus buchneri DSM 20057]MCT3252043.1 class A beta-lactamase-related serine hydrolase [Lentilactobacillus buchneri]MCT3546632.1 class A beta-lactamase-related serine hydrolase [Lentilactobacillus buchneri]MCT4437225.1 class A beta-lactamase-related serine hydrolase [Lentilactobacillus buchneri]MQM70304.1 beta-lactamase family protein [Lentilactobacillus buchneri]
MDYPNTVTKIHQFVDAGIVPGVSYAIIDRDGLQTNVFGQQELLPERLPLHSGELYDLASLTKVIGTTNLILRLLASGKISLDDSLTKYFPRWQSPQVTIRHLLTHTSDIVGYIPNRNQLPKSELMPALLALKSGSDIGKVIHYQDYNFIFLGWIASRVMGEPVQQLISEFVLRPLELNQATFTPDQVNNVVPTELIPSKGLIRGTVHDPKARILGPDCGSAGLFAPLSDLIHFSKWLLGDVKYPNFLPADWVDQLFVDQTPGHMKNRSFGWILRHYNGHPYILHTGYTGTLIVVDRYSHKALVFLSNRVHPDPSNQLFLPYRSQLIRTFVKENEIAYQ